MFTAQFYLFILGVALVNQLNVSRQWNKPLLVTTEQLFELYIIGIRQFFKLQLSKRCAAFVTAVYCPSAALETVMWNATKLSYLSIYGCASLEEVDYLCTLKGFQIMSPTNRCKSTKLYFSKVMLLLPLLFIRVLSLCTKAGKTDWPPLLSNTDSDFS